MTIYKSYFAQSVRAHVRKSRSRRRMTFCCLHHSHFRVAYCGVRMAEPDGESSGQYFEGVEKLLEIWFKKTDGDSSQCDLRNIPRQKLENMLKIVRCEVISFMQNDEVDAYVLSESSMFVAERRLILKTCGTTTPLQCLKSLLVLVEQYAGFNEVEDVYYSRKNFKRPDLQTNPHKSFEQEVLILNSIFQDGTAYCFGSKDQDCWYLYTLNPLAGDDQQQKGEEEAEEEADQTLEILMSELDPEVMSIFTRDESSSAAEATRKSGIEKLIPDMLIDDYLFEPCGYSMNGITKSGHYMTIHITPEPDFSYVSFETNVPHNSYKELIDRVLKTFQPKKFVVTVFANKTSAACEAPQELEKSSSFGELLCHSVQYCHLKNFDLTYAFYSKFPS